MTEKCIERIPTAESDSTEIPEKYKVKCGEQGRVIEVEYETIDYVPTVETVRAKIIKTASVYLPFGYDEGGEYDVVYVLHGVGGDERNDWLNENNPNPADILDNLIYHGDIKPCVAVFPNGRATTVHNNRGNSDGYWQFGKELRYELIPYIEANFAVGNKRDNRALCGLSMGGFQTAQIGILECYDLFSAYGIFSASLNHGNPYVYATPERIASRINRSELGLKYLFFCIGTEDFIIRGLRPELEELYAITDKSKLSDGVNSSHVYIEGGRHNYGVWQVSIYDFLQLITKK